MNKLFLFAILLWQTNVFSQKIIEEYKQPEGYLRTGPEQEQMIPNVEKGFTLLLPEAGEVNGVIIVPAEKRLDVKEFKENKGPLEDKALKKNLAVIHITSGSLWEFYFSDDIIKDIVKRLESVLTDNDLKGKPVCFTGHSLAGTRAVKLAIYLQENREKYWLQPAAVVIADAPLDMVRLWDAENRAIINNYYPAAVNEAKLVTYLLKENIGTPEENFNNYVDYSPFVYVAEDGGNAEVLRNIPVRAYQEADVMWWIDNRRKDYYSMNAVDLAGLINQLRLLNNDNAGLITSDNNHREMTDGSSDKVETIIDYSELIDWFLSFQY